jgi:hypothetical protein
MMGAGRFAACALLLVAAACGNGAEASSGQGAPAGSAGEGTRFRMVALPSGRSVKVLGVKPMHFAEGPPSLMLSYETGIPLDSVAPLAAEADEIFASFKADAESGGFSGSILSANEPPGNGIISRGQGFDFIFQRAMNGVWTRLDN